MNELFYLIASCLILASIGVTFSPYPMHSVLFLISTFVLTSILWLTLDAEFLALALIFIYVGAVMVLFLFIVFMLNVNKLFCHHNKLLLIGFGGLLYYVASQFSEQLPMHQDIVSNVSNTKALGILLYQQYWVAFELVGCILLAAMVAVIYLVDEKSMAKKQDISLQVERKKEDCITWME